MHPRIRAVVLAAGRGERLRPLTDLLPKPLLPVLGRPVAEHTLARLAAVGCEAAAVNLHHLGGQVERALGAEVAGMPVTYAPEEVLLGTLGPLVGLRDFLAEADAVVVVNGDSLCRWPLRRLLRRHFKAGTGATFLLARHADPDRFGGGLALDEEGNVVSFRGAPEPSREGPRRRVFAGAHVLSPDLLHGLEPGPADSIEDLYAPRLRRGERFPTLETARHWHDLGTPRRYLAAVLDWARGRPPRRWIRHTWIGPGASRAKNAGVAASVLEPGARVERGTRVERSLVMAGSRIGERCTVRGSIIGPGVSIPPGTWVEARLVTPERPGSSPRDGASTVGGLLFTPI